jgi:hypothetical protein
MGRKIVTGLGGRLAGDLGEGVLSQAGIENGIGDLVAAACQRGSSESRW